MKKLSAALCSGALILSASTFAQSWEPPTPAQRCPSKWGATDERGAANHMRPESVLRATRLIKTGEVIELGWVLSMDMPFFGTRRFDVHLKRTGGPMGTNKRYTNEELVITELGQVGTQFDMFSHQGDRRSALQLREDRRHRHSQRLHQAGRGQDRHAVHSRRAGRRGRL